MTASTGVPPAPMQDSPLPQNAFSFVLSLFVILFIVLFVFVVLFRAFVTVVGSRRGEHDSGEPDEATRRAQLQGQKRNGLDQSAIDAIPIVTLDEKQVNSLSCESHLVCAVCLADYQVGEVAKKLPPCSHQFHAECIDAWLLAHSTCPICRVSLKPPCKCTLKHEGAGVETARAAAAEAAAGEPGALAAEGGATRSPRSEDSPGNPSGDGGQEGDGAQDGDGQIEREPHCEASGESGESVVVVIDDMRGEGERETHPESAGDKRPDTGVMVGRTGGQEVASEGGRTGDLNVQTGSMVLTAAQGNGSPGNLPGSGQGGTSNASVETRAEGAVNNMTTGSGRLCGETRLEQVVVV